jgi:hypothetical protein
VAIGASGGFIVAWTSDGQDGSSLGVFGRRFSTSGAPLASEFQVNSYTAGSQGSPSVAGSATGDFLIAWSSSGQDGYGSGVFARRFSGAGAPLASEFQVNTFTSGGQFTPSVAAEASGDFIVAWGSNQQGGSVFARRVSSAGTALATEFQINTYTNSLAGSPAIAAGSESDLVVAWVQSSDIFAQRLAFQKALDIDGDGITASLTDGVLVMRFLFGFTGTALTGGAVNASGCTRCDAAAIEAYLETLS